MLRGVSMVLGAVIVLAMGQFAFADTVNFSAAGFSGPNTFATTPETPINVTTSIGTVVFNGGTILTGALNSPDTGSIYATTNDISACGNPPNPLCNLSGFTNPLTITFPTAVTGFSVEVANGCANCILSYKAFDPNNLANTATVAITADGLATISLSSAVTVVDIQGQEIQGSLGLAWDFAINNVAFNGGGGGTAVPEPGALVLTAAGLAMLAGLAFWKKGSIANLA